MNELVLQRPSEKQILFLKDHHKHVMFGGARGGGKSWVVRDKAKRLALRYPGIRLLIVRRTYQELENNHIQPLQGELAGIAKYIKAQRQFFFPNGSTLRFGYCAKDSDLDQYQGTEYDVIFLDEATQLKELWIRKITACVRGVNDFPKRVYYTCNPGGVSHGYMKRLFIDRKFEPGENPGDYSFIQSLVTDNKALMESQPDYVDQLKALPPKLRDAWLHGRWDVYEGQFFEELRLTPDPELCARAGITVEEALQQRRFTHVIPAFDLNAGERRGWKILRSYDFGYNKPFSLGYWAVDYDGVLYRILELYGCTGTPDEGVKWTPEEQFRRIAQLEREHPWLRGRKISDGVADPAIWDSSRGECIADTAAKYGIYFTPGDNHRIPGWMQVHYRLQFDENGYPRM
ncbi:MAG: phage terminase large subunit, partial [Clostridiales bacterium]|nr:phage terminase large subunit [Clostridiales bacterium]